MRHQMPDARCPAVAGSRRRQEKSQEARTKRPVCGAFEPARELIKEVGDAF